MGRPGFITVGRMWGCVVSPGSPLKHILAQVPCEGEENLHCYRPRWDIPQFRKSGIFSLAQMGSSSSQEPRACLQQNWCFWPIPSPLPGSLKNNGFCSAFFKSKPYSNSAFSLTDLSRWKIKKPKFSWIWTWYAGNCTQEYISNFYQKRHTRSFDLSGLHISHSSWVWFQLGAGKCTAKLFWNSSIWYMFFCWCCSKM